MKSTTIFALALVSSVAVASEANYINPFEAVGKMTRAQVKAELAAAKKAGLLMIGENYPEPLERVKPAK